MKLISNYNNRMSFEIKKKNIDWWLFDSILQDIYGYIINKKKLSTTKFNE